MSSPEFSVWLPFPPSVNNLFSQAPMRSKRTGRMVVRRFPTKAYKRWQREAQILVLAAKPPRYTEPVVVKLELVPRDCRARDADNYCKPVLDILVAARVLLDDSNRFVKAVIPYWENPDANSGVMVSIRLARHTRREMLNANERRALARIKRLGVLTVRPGYRTNALQSLLQKAYVRALPGLFEFSPQGYVAID